MGNNPSTAALPEEPAPPTPGGGLPQHRSPNGGQLFKFVEDAYQVVSANVTPEVFDDGDDESPAWMLDVRATPAPPRVPHVFDGHFPPPASPRRPSALVPPNLGTPFSCLLYTSPSPRDS